jgi:hypothetical protein
MSYFNPFDLGFTAPEIHRVLEIEINEFVSPLLRRVHPMQDNWFEDCFVGNPCHYSQTHAWTYTKRQEPEEEILRAMPDSGKVVGVRYALTARDRIEMEVNLGFYPTYGLALNALKRVNPERTPFARAWEITDRHLDKDDLTFLKEKSGSGGKFYTVHSPLSLGGIAVELIATPWTNANLNELFGLRVRDLVREQLQSGMPKNLLKILHLAARANIRYLIFRVGGVELSELEVFEHEKSYQPEAEPVLDAC